MKKATIEITVPAVDLDRLRQQLRHLEIPESFITDHLAQSLCPESAAGEASRWTRLYIYPTQAAARRVAAGLFDRDGLSSVTLSFLEDGAPREQTFLNPASLPRAQAPQLTRANEQAMTMIKLLLEGMGTLEKVRALERWELVCEQRGWGRPPASEQN